MAVIRAQVILRTVDNVVENFISNSLAFEVPVTLDAPDDLTPLIKDFHDDLSGLHSPVIAQTGHQIKYTSLPGLAPRYPFETDLFDFTTAPSGTALPDEVAICLSFQGQRTAGLPQARRRGRIYFGPLRTTAATGNRPSTTLISTLATAAATFGAQVSALGAGYAWGVWSPSDQELVEISDGWVDNAFDTQRRRGVATTSRTTFVV